MPRPPHTESMSTPSVRPASSTVVPAGNAPRRPEGVKITSGSVRRHGRRAELSRRPRRGGRLTRRGRRAGLRGLAPGRRVAVGEDPRGGVGVVAHQHVGGHDRRADLGSSGLVIAEVRPLLMAIGEERGVDPLAVRQAEAHVRRAAGGVDLELVAQPADAGGTPAARRCAIAPIGMTSGSTMTSSRGMPWSAARSTIRLATAKRTSGSSEMPVSSLEMATTAAPYLPDQRQDPLEALLLAGHRVHERLALVDARPGLERLHDRRVDRERQVDERLDEPDRVGQDRRLVGERDARVDVEHVGAGLDLGERVALDAAEVAVAASPRPGACGRWG